MQQNRELLSEIKNSKKPYFVQTDILRAHKGIAKQFKFKARNENATDVETAINSMCDILHNLIRINRNNATQILSIGITEHVSKPREVFNDEDLVNPISGVIYRKGTISIPTNERVFDDKYHHSDIFSLYRRSSIRRLLDNLTQYLIQNRENNMARLEGTSNHKLELINNIYIKFHKINPRNPRTYIPTPKKLLNICLITAISVYYDEIDKKHANRISKNLLKCCERLNIKNIKFPLKIKDIEQIEKDNPDISITIFEYDGFQKIKKDVITLKKK